MRVFLISCLAVVVLAVGGFLTLAAVQKPSGVRYTTDGARINPMWSFRQVFSKTKQAPKTVAMAMPSSENVGEEGCEVSNAWLMILADFRSPEDALGACDH
jgi:hypothetical protein